jgi:hypothetical protein
MRTLALLTVLALPAAAQPTPQTPAPAPVTAPRVTAAHTPAHKPIHKPAAKSTPVAHHTSAIPARPAPHTVAHKSPSRPKTAAPRLVAAAPVTPAPFSQNPILQLRGNARALIVFAPDSRLPAARQQLASLGQHTLELTQRDTVFVPVITVRHPDDDIFPGENITPGTYRDQLSARAKFGLKYNDFAVILLSKDGLEQHRWTTPASMTDITSTIDGTSQQASLR